METEGRREISNTSGRAVEETRNTSGSCMRCGKRVSAQERGKGWTNVPEFVVVMRTEALKWNFRNCGAVGKTCVKYPCSSSGEWASSSPFPASFHSPSENKPQTQSYADFRHLMNSSEEGLENYKVV